MSGLLLDGSLSVVNATLADISTVDISANIQAEEFTADRAAATASQSYTYYIMADYDINSAITHTASGSGGTDDSWAMSAIRIESANATNPVIALPSASGIDVPAGLITAKDTDASTAGTFPVTLTLGLSDQGVLSATAAITGADVTSSATAENVLKAQIVQWDVNGVADPNVEATTQDVLTDVLSASELETQYASELAALIAAYNGVNVVSSWTIAITEVAPFTNSVLSKHARNLSKTNASVFAAGEKIVASDFASYSVSIDDYEGNSVAVASGTVYGVVNQSA